MVCEHLQQLYQLCLSQKIRLGGSDLIHIVCRQCGRQDVCPTNLRDDHDDDHDDERADASQAGQMPKREQH